MLDDIHSARSKCFRPKGAPAPEPNWDLLKNVNDFVEEFFHDDEHILALQHLELSVKAAYIKDKIYFQFGLEDEDIFYLLDVYRKKHNYQDKNHGFNERIELREFFLKDASTKWEDF